MKKTLAAVLAAAMALSTATVAMAYDYEIDFAEGAVSGSVSGIADLKADMGSNTTYLIKSVTTEDGNVIDGTAIAEAMSEGQITATVVVTNNQSKLDGRPTLTYGKTDVFQNVAKTVTYEWKNHVDALGAVDGNVSDLNAYWDDIANLDVASVVAGEEATVICLTDGDQVAVPGTEVKKIVKKGTTAYNTAMATLKNSGWFTEKAEATAVKDELPQLKFKINHTYGTDSVTVKMKLRFTAKKDAPGVGLNKGDTFTSEEVSFTAKYEQLSGYYRDMQLTTSEVGANRVLLDGGRLYDEIGNDTFTITFGDDVAMFKGKSASNQKTVNLYYSLGEIDEIKNAYPDVDFQFITFKGNPAPTFAVTGEMVFAAWDKNTTVYSWDGEVLEPISDPKNYDNTYKTITVKNVKRLGTYVISSEILEVEEEPEEPAEPVDSTPVAEPDEDEGGNPNTGAC